MTSLDSPTLSDSSLSPDGVPPSPADVQDWLDGQIDALAATIETELARIIDTATSRFVASLPPTDALVAADMGAFDDASSQWQAFVATDLAPQLGLIHLEGSLTAFIGASMADTYRLTTIADLWTPVVNDAAVLYASQATNRLVGVGNTTWGMLRSQVATAVQQGHGTEQLKKDIQGMASGFSEFRADTIARTETLGAFNNGDRVGAEALGPYGPVEKQWLATEDRRTRPSHLEADGQVVKFSEPFTVGGVSMMNPHAPGAPAAEVVNCRCICLHLYEGDLRPDGSEVGASTAPPIGVTPVGQDWGPADGATTAQRADRLGSMRGEVYNQFEERIPDPNAWGGERVNYGGYNTDGTLNDIARARNIDGLPTVGTTADVDRALADGGVEMLRGFGNRRALDQFVGGTYESGTGLYGSGFYTGKTWDVAESYTRGSGTNVVRMALRPDAKIIELDDALAQMEKVGPDASAVVRHAAEDPGRWAALGGYDAIGIKSWTPNGYTLLLNRSAAIIDGATL